MKTLTYAELENLFQADYKEFFLKDDRSIPLKTYRVNGKWARFSFEDLDGQRYEFGFTKQDIVITVDQNNVMITDSEGNEKVCRFSVYNLVPAEL